MINTSHYCTIFNLKLLRCKRTWGLDNEWIDEEYLSALSSITSQLICISWQEASRWSWCKMLSVIMKEEAKKKTQQILLFSFHLRIGQNLWCSLWGIKESKSIPIFLQSDPRLTPSLSHHFFSNTFICFFFFFFHSFLVFIRDQRCTSTDTLPVCSHTWSTVLFPPSHLKLRSKWP